MPRILDLQHVDDSAWDNRLVRIDEGGFNPEGFEPWIERNKDLVGHLPREVCEQWIFRHGKQSPFCFIPLAGLKAREELWSVDRFLAEVKTWRGNELLDPVHDYEVFRRPYYSDTARALDQGAWDYAPIVMPTPGGYIDSIGEYVSAEYILVEGHQRRRYLNALLHRGEKVPDQRVFIIEGNRPF